jgi:hypothetical protein
MALSHCWGTSTPIITTCDTINDRMKGIKFEEMTKTFQDAVSVTRNLGIQYLCIDSLCIVQGDQQDWEREASRMADV